MKAVALLSSGIDSPVASYLMMSKGFDVVALHMDARPYSDDAGVEKSLELAKKAGEAADRKVKTYVVPNRAFQEAVKDKCTPRLACVLCKRFMYRVAEAVAEREGAGVIVTGESIGQVASQTLSNLRALDAAISLPVVRPLIGFDKEDTIRVAREIGTFPISSRKSAACPFVPKAPATQAKMDEVLKEEQSIDVDTLVAESLAKAEVKE